MDNHSKPVICQMYGKLTESAQVNQAVYKEVAAQYDNGFMEVGSISTNKLSEMVEQYYAGKSTKDLCALDVCAGSGLCGEALRRAGWLGSIDGVDGCQELLNVALRKNVYRTLHCQQITADTPISTDKSHYDLITCTGGLSFGHLPHECLEMLVNMLMSEGILAINVSNYKNPGSDVEYKDSVLKTMNRLKGKCTLVKEDQVDVSKEDRRHACSIDYERILFYQRV